MKKEFTAINVTCRFASLINSEDITKAGNFVLWKIRSAELETLKNDKDFRGYMALLESTYPTTNSYTDEQIKAVTTADYELFKAHSKLIEDAQSAVDAIPVKLEDFNALHPTDKAFILIEAHKNMKSIAIEIDGDFQKPVNNYLNAGKMADVKNLFRSAFNVAVGKPGELFAGYKLKKSDFSDSDIRKAVSQFVKGAGRPETTVKDPKTGEKIKKVGSYDWKINTDKKTASRIASDLFGVIIESRADQIEKVYPEGKAPETVGGLEPDNEPGGITPKKKPETKPETKQETKQDKATK